MRYGLLVLGMVVVMQAVLTVVAVWDHARTPVGLEVSKEVALWIEGQILEDPGVVDVVTVLEPPAPWTQAMITVSFAPVRWVMEAAGIAPRMQLDRLPVGLVRQAVVFVHAQGVPDVGDKTPGWPPALVCRMQPETSWVGFASGAEQNREIVGPGRSVMEALCQRALAGTGLAV